MNLSLLNRNEIKRYMSGSEEMTDNRIHRLIEETIDSIENFVNPKFIYKKLSIYKDSKKVYITNTSIEIISKDLLGLLKNSSEVVFLSATLGLLLDREIRRLEIIDLTKAYILHAVAVEYIEVYLNTIVLPKIEESLEKNKVVTERFSPGYGDFPLYHQKDFENILSIYKNIGVSVLENNLLVPSKSITALMGIEEKGISRNIEAENTYNTCGTCIQCEKDCLLRRT